MITQKRLMESIVYDPEDGTFTRAEARARRWKKGQPAGTIDQKGYLKIKIDGKTYAAHRLAVLYMTGMEWQQVYHVNGDKADNRWANLRKATPRENSSNTRLSRANTSGVKGVNLHKPTGKWLARVAHKHLGLFVDLADADKACREAREELYGPFANHGLPT